MAEEGTAEGWTTYQQTEAQSARTFALVGIAWYILGSVVAGIALVTGLFTFLFVVTPFPFGFEAVGFIFPAVYMGIAAALTVWSWGTLQQIEQGRYQEAQAPVLVQGILGLFFALFIGGFFLILAYVKLGNVVSPRPAAPAMAAPVPVAPQPAGGRVCPNCGRPIPMDAKFCNYCGHELPSLGRPPPLRPRGRVLRGLGGDHPGHLVPGLPRFALGQAHGLRAPGKEGCAKREGLVLALVPEVEGSPQVFGPVLVLDHLDAQHLIGLVEVVEDLLDGFFEVLQLGIDLFKPF